MDEQPAPHHANPRPAEYDAAVKVAPHLKKMKLDIMTRAVAAAELGLIPDEVDGLINTVRRRFTDLWKEGLLRPMNVTRLNKRGNPETIWVAGRDPLAKKKRVEVMAKVVGFGSIGAFGPDQIMRVTVEVTRAQWDALPSPVVARLS